MQIIPQIFHKYNRYYKKTIIPTNISLYRLDIRYIAQIRCVNIVYLYRVGFIFNENWVTKIKH